MARWLGWTADLVIVVAAVGAVVPAAREALHWQWARVVDRPEDFDSFRTTWPDSHRTQEAITRHDETRWRSLQTSTDAAAFEDFAATTQRGTHKAEATERADRLRYEQARQLATATALQDYVDRHPQGAFVAKAGDERRALLSDVRPYLVALGKAEAKVMRQFLLDFPGHSMQAQAEGAARDLEGRDLFEFVREKRVQLRPALLEGSQVSVTLTGAMSDRPRPLVAKISPGTLLVPRQPGAGSLVVLRDVRILVKDATRVSQAASVAWVQGPPAGPAARSIEPGSVPYDLRPAPPQSSLSRLALAIAEAQPPQAVAQLAVWITSTNPGFAGLVALSERARQARPEAAQAAAALQLVERSGLPLSGRTLWRERAALAAQLPPGELRDWLAKPG